MSLISRCAPALSIVACILTLPLVAGYWGSLHPAFDSLAHFRLHLAALIIILAIIPLFVRKWLNIALALILFGIAAAASTMAKSSSENLSFHEIQNQSSPQPRYRLLQLSLGSDNLNLKKVLSLIGKTKPDIIALNQLTEQWLNELTLIETSYPYHLVCETSDKRGGVGILSRRPIFHESMANCHNQGALAIATINFGGIAVDIASLLLDRPWPGDQQQQVLKIADELDRLPAATILAGNLNATWWSETSRLISRHSELIPLNNIGPTWLPGLFPELFRRNIGLPMDNIFVKGQILPYSTSRLENIGSTHLPILLEFGIINQPHPETVTVKWTSLIHQKRSE